MKKLLVTVLFTSLGLLNYAQSSFGTLHADVGLASGSFATSYSWLYGIGVGFEMPFGDKLGAGVSVGYTFVKGKTINDPLTGYSDETDNSYFVPIQLLGKYYFQDQQEGLYAGLHAGIHLYEDSKLAFDSAGNVIAEASTGSVLSFAPTLGFVGTGFDWSLRYQFVSTPGVSSNYIAIRLSYLLFSSD